jgi:predicted ATPase/DNA-binding SARP family transcriptional activator
MDRPETAFRVLGSVEVTVDGRPALLGGPKQQAVLAVLLAHANKPVSRDLLIEEVWGDNGPATAENALQVYVSQLRRAICPTALVTTPNGYCVPTSQRNLDSARFGVLLGEGREALQGGDHEAASQLLKEALSLWRGEPFLGLEATSVVSEAARLSERRLAAIESLVDADLELGNYDEVVSRLRDVTAARPQRERFTGQLMLALYRSGRQSEALEEFGRARQELLSCQGVEPGLELRTLYRQILAHDPSLARGGGQPPPVVPVPTTSFVGRDEETRQLGALCRSARLVTITGPAGCGKTRLALEATRSTGEHPDGVFLVELSRIPEPSLVPFAVASALGATPIPGNDPVDLLAAQFQDRRILLILDTCEHLRDTCEQTAGRLLDTCPELQIIATSRTPLGGRYEATLPIGPLSAPADPDSLPVEELMDYPAIRLLGDRAQEVRQGLNRLPETVREFAEVCRLLNGVPLAIELAAKRLRHGSLPELVTELRQHLLALKDDRRVGDRRERSLRAAIVWSYELLDPTEQAVFDRLSVFSGPFDADTVATVCSDSPATAPVTEALDRLRDASMLVGDGPYRLLDSLRAFAAEQLHSAGEADSLRQRHLSHFQNVAEQAQAGLLGPEYAAWMSALNAAYPDLRAATAWALARGNAEAAGRIIGHLHRYHLAVGQDTQWVAWIDQVLEGSLSPEVLVRVRCARAWAALQQNDLDRAEVTFRSACDLSRTAGMGRGLTSLGLGSMWFYKRADAAAIEELRRSISYAADEKDDHSRACALNALGCVYATTADAESARRYYAESLDLALELADPELASFPRANLGWELFAEGEDERARDMMRAAVDTVESLGNPYLICNGQADLGFIAFVLGEYGEAGAVWRSSLRLAARMGWAEVAARALMGLGSLSAASGDLSTANRLWGAANGHHRALSEKPTWVELTIARRLPDEVRPRFEREWESEWKAGESLTLQQAAELVGLR